MGANTSIAWATHTFNPWIGCTRVSPGCVNCYAETQDARGLYGGTKHWGPGKPRHLTSEAYMRQPFAWNEEQRQHERVHLERGTMPVSRPRVFCLSMGDICDPDAPPHRRVPFGVKATELLKVKAGADGNVSLGGFQHQVNAAGNRITNAPVCAGWLKAKLREKGRSTPGGLPASQGSGDS